jgi:D-apionolactonase
MPPVIYDGTGKALPESLTLRAGALSLVYADGMVRSVRLGSQEIVRAVYAAVRDQNWATIPGGLCDVKIDQRANAFDITFTSEHRQGDVHFVWHGEISGSADSIIRFSFDGEALSQFKRNRIGFCILHPMEIAGTACDVEIVDGGVQRGEFPRAISPHQPFFDIRAITHEVSPGLRAEVRMEGDTFEMEDQRNWIDASYKTYCTPLGLPYPVTVEAGTKIQQQITVRLLGSPANISVSENAPTIHIDKTAVALPALGLGTASHGQALTEVEIQRLQALNLSHLRLDLEPSADIESVLDQASSEANRIGCPLELVIHVGENAEADLNRAASAVETLKPNIARILVYDYHQHATRRSTVEAARRILERFGVPIGSGTDAFFTELNRNRPPAELLDWVAYSINPQVHAFDNLSLVETLLTAGVTVESARAFSGTAKIAVTPITLKMRWNPNATAPDAPTPAGELPRQVDPRQMSLFGAAWTVGAIKSLALSQADSVTFYETTGWLGVMEREGGSPLPEKFASVAGGVFPMYHVFADVGAFAGGEALHSTSSHPFTVDALALRKDGQLRLLVANYTDQPQQVTLTGLSESFTRIDLDETTADIAARDPEQFRLSVGTPIASDLSIALLPYAVTRLDLLLEKSS